MFFRSSLLLFLLHDDKQAETPERLGDSLTALGVVVAVRLLFCWAAGNRRRVTRINILTPPS